MYWMILKQKLRQLCREESGVAFIYLSMMSLVALLAVMSIMAVGQVAQDRMELQDAVDNAAYAGAVVQADCLSRLAVLNRAMAWTYVQTNRRQTDYIMNQYATNVVDMYDSIYNTIQNRSKQNSLNSNKNRAAANSTANVSNTTRYDVQMTASQNGSSWTTTRNTINNVVTGTGAGTSFSDLEDSIQDGAANIAAMNNAITAIADNLEASIRAAVTSAFEANCSAGVTSACICQDASNYLTSYTDEDEFLNRCYKSGETVNADGWQSLSWWNKNTKAPGTRRGFYWKLNRILKVELQGRFWDYLRRTTMMGGYTEDEDGPYTYATRPNYDKTGSYSLSNDYASVTVGGTYAFDTSETTWYNTSVGGTATSATWGTSETAYPAKLTSAFFGKAGSIIVAAKRPMRNPFEFMKGSNSSFDIGFYGAYGESLIASAFPICAVAASRAGYRLSSEAEGRYHTTWQDEPNWNLFVDDWDAVMLPICKAWQDGRKDAWVADTGKNDEDYSKEVLSQVATELNITGNPWGLGGTSPDYGGEYDVLH